MVAAAGTMKNIYLFSISVYQLLSNTLQQLLNEILYLAMLHGRVTFSSRFFCCPKINSAFM